MKAIVASNRLNIVEEYYFSRKLKEVKMLQEQGKPIINMGIGSPDLPPANEVITALEAAIHEPNAHQYQSYQGLPQLRLAMSNFYKNNYKVALNPNTEILPLMGSKEGILHISMAFLNSGDGVLIPNPGYPTYISVTNLVEAKPIFYDLEEKNNWEPDFDALEKLDLTTVKIMWVSYPHMPTGASGSKELFQKLIDFGKKHQILIVNDNPYSFVLNSKPISIFQADGAFDVALELNSLSKTFNMAGWRIGMVVGNTTFLDAVLKVKSNQDSGMFYGLQKGAIAALNLPNSWFDNLNKTYKNRRNLMFELAKKLSCTFDENQVGLFVWAKLPKHEENAEAFVDRLLYQKNIFVTPGIIFGTNGSNYIRFSLCVNEEKIKEAIERV
jgi:LL-diaminopimelate aminotransferase